MTAPNQLNNSFARQRLPWIIGGAGWLVYLSTLNHWISLTSLATVARTAGWLWQPEAGRPLTLAILFPFRMLPDSWLPLVLNFFIAMLAGLALAQLARSVVLLRYNVPSEDPFQQGKPIAAPLGGPYVWMPPTLAALVCGLQLTFWENATAATGEMISLLFFAYALRCLLEFRASEDQSWLSRCVCVYAAGMADNWTMVGYAPVLITTLIWTRGFGPFLQPRFLFRITAWGLVGLSLYLLIPTMLSLSGGDQPVDFKTTLVTHLKSQKQMLALFRAPSLRILVLMALLPAVFLAVRWRSHTVQFADDTQLGVVFIKAAGHCAHALFFLASLWIALNPAFLPLHKDLGLPLLTFYYVWALMTGYCAGYFLLFKAGQPRRPSKYPAYGLALSIGLMLLLLPWRNFPEIRATNNPAVRELARQLYQDLPAGKSIVFSEDPKQLLLLRAELTAHGPDKNPLLVDTPALVWPQYHKAMAARYGSRWPTVSRTNEVEKIGPTNLLPLASQLAAAEPIYYLHPSSGFFLEEFSDAPAGLLHRLSLRNEAADANLAPESVATNNRIWQQRWVGQLQALTEQFAKLGQNSARWSRTPFEKLRLARRHNATTAFLGAVYSKALNHWGVELRQSGDKPGAVQWFARSLEMNPDNLAARINLEYATRCERGECARLKLASIREEFSETLGKYENWWEVISQNGPVDEPTFLFQSGRVFMAVNNPRQAASLFARCAELAPTWPAPKLWQAQSFNIARQFEKAVELTDQLNANRQELKGPGLAQLVLCRTTALRGAGRTNEAAAYLEDFVSKHGEHVQVLNAAASLYAASSQFEQELRLREILVQRNANNPEWLAKKGLVEIRLVRFETATATLTQALNLAPNNLNLRLLRAIAYLRAGKLEAAKADYRELLKNPDASQTALFGLGGIAWRENDTNTMIQYYERFLSNSAAITPQFNTATERLRQIQEDN